MNGFRKYERIQWIWKYSVRIKGFSENKRIQGIIRKWIWMGLVKFNIVQWFIDVSEYKKIV